MDIFSKVTLNNGVKMPWLGLGVFRLREGREIENAILTAIETGYRSIDTASFYMNERGVGKAVKNCRIPRDEIFITTKVWNSEQGYHSTKAAFERSLNKLQVDYIDLYLIHWPVEKTSVETWKAMEELYKNGKVRAIGVSNFLIHHLEDFLPNCSIKPVVNQVEFHPQLTQPELLKFCRQNEIQPEAWSPIMKGRVNNIPLLKTLGNKYGKTPVQIVLRWDIQKGIITIPKSSNPERIQSNANIFDFEISGEDMIKIDQIDRNNRTGFYSDHLHHK